MSKESLVCGFESMRAAQDAIVARLVKSIKDTDIIAAPFPHFVIDSVLPEQVFDELIGSLPELESMPSVAQKGWTSVAQYDNQRTSLFGELEVRNPNTWLTLEQALLDNEVERAAIDKFGSS